MMTFRETIDHVMNRGAVAHVLSCVYHSYYNNDVNYVDVLHQYTCVIRELLNLDPEDRYADHQINLREVVDDEQSCVGVFLQKDDDTYAIDYIDWKQLIDLTVNDQAGLQTHEVVAHILWEISFHGFTNSKVNKSRENLENLCKSVSGA